MSVAASPLPAPEAIRAGGETLLVRRLGEGERLVLFHGGPGLDHHLLLPLAQELAEDFEVWLPDLPGHGRNGAHPLSLRQTLDRLARWLPEIAPRILGGHSLGAWLVRELLREKAASAAAVLLLCPPGPLRGRAARQALSELRGQTEQQLREELIAELQAEGPVDPRLKAALETATLRRPERHARLVEDLLPLLRAAVPRFDPHLPVLVLAGERDRVAPPSVARAVAQATRGAVVEVLPGAGHVLWAAGAGPTAEVVRGFLEGVGDLR